MSHLIKRPKRRAGNKIQPKLQDRTCWCNHNDGIVRPGMVYRGTPGFHHDNGKVTIGTGYGHGNIIRFPSLKRSNTIWRNFYKLFPRVYFIMRKKAEEEGVAVGGTVIWHSGSVNHLTSRHIPMRVLDLTGEFKRVCNKLMYHEHLYYGVDSTILNNKENEIFIQTI